MQLSERYAKQSTYTFNTGSSSQTVVFNVSDTLANIFATNKEMDYSMVYTMCIDPVFNKFYTATNGSLGYTHFKMDVDEHSADSNFVSFHCRDENNATNLKTSYRRYTNDTTQSDGVNYTGERLFTDISISRLVLIPNIAVINKSDVLNDTTYYGTQMFNPDLVKLVTLKELMEHKNEYIVINMMIGTKYRNRADSYYVNLYGVTPALTVIKDGAYTGGSTGFWTGQFASSASPFSYNQSDFFAYTRNDGTGGGSSGSSYFSHSVDPITPNSYTNKYNHMFPIYPINITNADFVDETNVTKMEEHENGGWIYKLHKSSSGTYKQGLTVKRYITADYAIKLLASYGLYIQYTNQTGWGDLSTNGLYAIGEMNEDGFTTGRIIPPSEMPSYNGANKTLDVYTDSIADPDKYKKQTEDLDSIKPMSTRTYQELTGFIRYYKMTAEKLEQFVKACQAAGSGLFNMGWQWMPSIISITQYPFDVSSYVNAEGTADFIKINGTTLDGNYGSDTGKPSVKAFKLTSINTPVSTLGSITVPRKYNNFLDYPPYTNVEVFVPLCGWISLPESCIGNEIVAKLVTDAISGTCKAQIWCNGLIIAEKQGIMGNTVPITGVENGLKTQGIVNAVTGIATSAIGLASGVVTGNAIGIASGTIGAIGSISQAITTANDSYTRTTGRASDDTGFYDNKKCYLKITYPISNIPANYGHTTGFICNKMKKIKDCKGFTVIHNPDLTTLHPTPSEAQQLKHILTTGFFA